jgi:3-dehydroquinate dehydratase/shikimate dehydrogenase
MRTRLCVTVAARTMSALRMLRDAADEADLVELRLDSVADPDVAAALSGRRRPVIITCRPRWEGGGFAGSEDERRRILAEAFRLGADYVDIEWRARFDDLIHEREGRGVVLSFHDFEGTPADLADRYRAMRRTGAEVVKVATHARRLTDLLPLLSLSRMDPDGRGVFIGMGAAGLPSRVLAARFGSAWTYAGHGIAPGQISAARMLEEFRYRIITADSPAYGIAGSPVGHSVSPAMHNAGFDAHGIDGVYVPLEAADADDLFEFARAVDLRGASVTAPFKRAVLERVDEADPVSRLVGAANTLVRGPEGWRAANTDVAGFLAPLQARFSLSGARAAILGAGGAARAAAVALASAGAQVSVHARDQARAAEVAALVGGLTGPLPPEPGTWTVLINTTPVGTYPAADASPVPAIALTSSGGAAPGRLVYDLVYNPPQTRLLRDAAAAGLGTLGGLDMLVEQARRQFEIWTGVLPAADVFTNAAVRRLAEAATEAAAAELSS